MSRAAKTAGLLRCTAFEEFMLDQDDLDHPCVICLRLDFEGELDCIRLKHALTSVVERHPLLRATLEMRWGKLWWRVHDENAADLRVHQAIAPAWPTARSFDLMQTVGLQADLFLTPSTNSYALFLQIHHAVTDGLGCLQIVADLMIEYERPGKGAQQPYSVDLHQRNRFGLNAINLLPLAIRQLVGLAGVRQFLTRRPVPMDCGKIKQSVSGRLNALKLQLTSERTRLLAQCAKRQQATLNDYLACVIFEACDELRRERTDYSRSDWLRMLVPISLRNAESQKLSACNVVSCIFLDRTGQQVAHRPELLKSIHDEMELIKRNRLGFVFIFSLWLRKIFRFRFRRAALVAAKPSKCQTSIVFSNMGRSFENSLLPTTQEGCVQAGQIILTGLEILAPVAPLMVVAITAFQYAGRITLSLRYDSSAISDDNAARLLEFIDQRIDRTAQEIIQA